MNIGSLFLKTNLTAIIPFTALDLIIYKQLKTNRLEESITLKLGRIIDSGIINLGCRLTS